MIRSLVPGLYYHIYNRGNNGDTLFYEPRNYRYFLQLFGRYIHPIVETYAYCLMPNHFHFLVQIRPLQDWQSSLTQLQLERIQDCQPFVSHQFRNFFSTYTKAVNKAYNHTGSLFEKPFKRKVVDNERYFTTLITYIHRNPQTHGFVDDFREWPWSSYQALLTEKPTQVQREAVLEWFGTRAALADAHLRDVDEGLIEPLIVDDWF
ncbi:transposase [Candidatus Leptofilum sp.]|uniref:transposase n=1 Tax=Candidatus Leptofilum sp. TaxID=3241576 RepID=UPI003B59B061